MQKEDMIYRGEAIKAVYDKDIGMLTQWDIGRNNGIDYAIKQLEKMQPVDAIPISWIEGEMAEIKSTGKVFSYILAELIGWSMNEDKRKRGD